MIQARILVGIERSGLSTVGGVGNLVGLSSGNASTMCKKLEKAGFIKRLRSLEDERLVKLVLTDEGRATLKKIDDVFREKYASLLEQWTEQDFTLIIAGMRKLSELISAMSMVD
ncbi:MAG: MarR family transcriptional regulator [Firmicutes bacterium]|nr:MarR family transcriptional regulator [Bacillota bacterium]